MRDLTDAEMVVMAAEAELRAANGSTVGYLESARKPPITAEEMGMTEADRRPIPSGATTTDVRFVPADPFVRIGQQPDQVFHIPPPPGKPDCHEPPPGT